MDFFSSAVNGLSISQSESVFVSLLFAALVPFCARLVYRFFQETWPNLVYDFLARYVFHREVAAVQANVTGVKSWSRNATVDKLIFNDYLIESVVQYVGHLLNEAVAAAEADRRRASQNRGDGSTTSAGRTEGGHTASRPRSLRDRITAQAVASTYRSGVSGEVTSPYLPKLEAMPYAEYSFVLKPRVTKESSNAGSAIDTGSSTARMKDMVAAIQNDYEIVTLPGEDIPIEVEPGLFMTLISAPISKERYLEQQRRVRANPTGVRQGFLSHRRRKPQRAKPGRRDKAGGRGHPVTDEDDSALQDAAVPPAVAASRAAEQYVFSDLVDNLLLPPETRRRGSGKGGRGRGRGQRSGPDDGDSAGHFLSGPPRGAKPFDLDVDGEGNDEDDNSDSDEESDSDANQQAQIVISRQVVLRCRELTPAQRLHILRWHRQEERRRRQEEQKGKEESASSPCGAKGTGVNQSTHTEATAKMDKKTNKHVSFSLTASDSGGGSVERAAHSHDGGDGAASDDDSDAVSDELASRLFGAQSRIDLFMQRAVAWFQSRAASSEQAQGRFLFYPAKSEVEAIFAARGGNQLKPRGGDGDDSGGIDAKWMAGSDDEDDFYDDGEDDDKSVRAKEHSMLLRARRFVIPVHGGKSFSTLFFSQKPRVLRLLGEFSTRSGKYAVPGVPHRLTVLLHGPPGTGKTSLVKAMARSLNRHVVVIPLTSMKTTTALMDWMSENTVLCAGETKSGYDSEYSYEVEVPKRVTLKPSEVIYLLEDVDAVGMKDLLIDMPLPPTPLPSQHDSSTATSTTSSSSSATTGEAASTVSDEDENDGEAKCAAQDSDHQAEHYHHEVDDNTVSPLLMREETAPYLAPPVQPETTTSSVPISSSHGEAVAAGGAVSSAPNNADGRQRSHDASGSGSSSSTSDGDEHESGGRSEESRPIGGLEYRSGDAVQTMNADDEHSATAAPNAPSPPLNPNDLTGEQQEQQQEEETEKTSSCGSAHSQSTSADCSASSSSGSEDEEDEEDDDDDDDGSAAEKAEAAAKRRAELETLMVNIVKDLRKDRLNVEGILRVLHGVMVPNDRVVVMTTNHPERLDPRLLMPGVVNLKIDMNDLEVDAALEMVQYYYEGKMTPRQAASLRHIFGESGRVKRSASGEYAAPAGEGSVETESVKDGADEKDRAPHRINPARLEQLCAECDTVDDLLTRLRAAEAELYTAVF